MARAIDGTWNSFLLNLSYLTLRDFQENKAGLNTLKTAVESQPTLTPPNEAIVHCADCANLMFSDYYGECKKGYLGGIVRPNDYCSRGIWREKTHEQI